MKGLDLYLQYRDQIKTADLIEWRSNSLLGWAIRKKTGYPVNHTSAALVYTLQGDTEPRRYIGESLAKGFKLNFLSDRLKDFDGEVYWSPLRSIYDSHRIPIAKELQNIEHRPYGFSDLVGNLFGPVKCDATNGLICSESFQVAMIREGLLNEDFNDGCCLVPGQFWMTSFFDKTVRIF